MLKIQHLGCKFSWGSEIVRASGEIAKGQNGKRVHSGASL
jgi:hypothetical protein